MQRLRILVKNHPIPIYYDNRGRMWVEGREDTKFKIEVKNNTSSRVLAVVSVDGLNVINAKHESPSIASGYIINAYDNIKIPGWKISDEKVRKFLFTSKENSYSKKVGAKPNNIGVIGAAIFGEKTEFAYTISGRHTNSLLDYSLSEDSTYASSVEWGCSANIQPLVSSHITFRTDAKGIDNDGIVGIGYINPNAKLNVCGCSASDSIAVGSGKKKDFKTETCYFNRGEIIDTLLIYYDTRENLIKRGIIKEGARERIKVPQAFPNTGEFCPDV